MIAIDNHFKKIKKFNIPSNCNYLDIGNNKLKSLELNDKLVFLNCFANQLTSLKVSGNVQVLKASFNQIKNFFNVVSLSGAENIPNFCG